jgi:hypothetical protein
MKWLIVNRTSGIPLNDRIYESEADAHRALHVLGEAIGRLYRPIPMLLNEKWQRRLVEGFKPNDLENILLPQFSVDVYVPSDPNTDNIVTGFLIKGVPEAVFPFRQFLSFCRGVKHVDYGDSDTLPHTSIVYVEFDRDRFHPDDLDDLIEQVCRISGFDSEDFSVSFPNSNATFPYKKSLIEEYFEERSRRKNRLSQDKAIHDRTQKLQQELEHEMAYGNIAKSFGAPAAQGGPQQPAAPETDGMKKLQNASAGIHSKIKKSSDKGTDISDSNKSMIVNDAKRNLQAHTETWEQFDKRWASRLRTTPTKVSSVRKRIYDL